MLPSEGTANERWGPAVPCIRYDPATGRILLDLPRPNMLTAVFFANLANLANAVLRYYHLSTAPAARWVYAACVLLALMAGQLARGMSRNDDEESAAAPSERGNAARSQRTDPLSRLFSVLLGTGTSVVNIVNGTAPSALLVATGVMCSLSLYSETVGWGDGARIVIPVKRRGGQLNYKPLPLPSAHSGVLFFGMAALLHGVLGHFGLSLSPAAPWAYFGCAALALLAGEFIKAPVDDDRARADKQTTRTRIPRGISAFIGTGATAMNVGNGTTPAVALGVALALTFMSVTGEVLFQLLQHDRPQVPAVSPSPSLRKQGTGLA